MEVRIGDLRHRLTLEEVVRQDDGSGGADETWVALDDLWAAVRPMSGTEREISDQLAGRVTHEIWVRYRAGVKPQHALQIGCARVRSTGGDRCRRTSALLEVSGRGARLVKVDVTVSGIGSRLRRVEARRIFQLLEERQRERRWQRSVERQVEADFAVLASSPSNRGSADQE